MEFLRIMNRTARFDRKRFGSDSKLFDSKAEKVEEPVDKVVSTKRRRTKQAADKLCAARASVDCDADLFADRTSPHPLLPSRQSAFDRHVEEVNRIRNAHRIRVKGTDIPAPISTFEHLNLPDYLLKNILSQWQTPTPIQMQAIPAFIAGRELLAVAPTGSGKTGAFMIPILTQLNRPQAGLFRAVVLAPTRELAQQTYQQFIRLSKGNSFGIFLLQTSNMANLADASQFGKRDILISTPKRLSLMIGESKCDLSQVEYLVFDEGDQIWDDGFLDDVDAIVAACSNQKITRALFSATMPESVEELARTILRDPVRILIGAVNCTITHISQRLLYAGNEAGKLIAVRNLFKEGIRPPVLIFVQSKTRARQLFHQLKFDGFPIGFIDADQSAIRRDEVIVQFRSGKLYALITTEILARGIDFIGVNCVVNYDFPQSIVSYIHRVGRTGRAGRAGSAVTLFTEEDAVLLRSVANVLKQSGCDDVPEWILNMRKPNRSRVKELKTRPPKRKLIQTSIQ